MTIHQDVPEILRGLRAPALDTDLGTPGRIGAPVSLTIDGVAVTGEGSISDAPRGYFVSYGMTSQMARLRDNPRFVLTKSGKPVFDVTLTDVSRVIGELLRCDAMVS